MLILPRTPAAGGRPRRQAGARSSCTAGSCATCRPRRPWRRVVIAAAEAGRGAAAKRPAARAATAPPPPAAAVRRGPRDPADHAGLHRRRGAVAGRARDLPGAPGPRRPRRALPRASRSRPRSAPPSTQAGRGQAGAARAPLERARRRPPGPPAARRLRRRARHAGAGADLLGPVDAHAQQARRAEARPPAAVGVPTVPPRNRRGRADLWPNAGEGRRADADGETPPNDLGHRGLGHRPPGGGASSCCCNGRMPRGSTAGSRSSRSC